MRNLLAVVVPVFNAENTLDQLYKELIDAAEKITANFQLIFVDDASSDNSWNIVTKIASADKRVAGLALTVNRGQQNAILCGLRHTDADYVVTIDDDLQYPPRYIEHLYGKIQEGFAVVYGIPEMRSDSSIRNFGTMATRLILQLVCMKPRKIGVSSFRILTRGITEQICSDNRRDIYISATTFLHTDNAANISIDRNGSENSRYSFDRLLRVFGNIALYYIPILSQFRASGPQYEIREIIPREKD